MREILAGLVLLVATLAPADVEDALQQRVTGIRKAVSAEIGAPMGLSQGFNSQDGDRGPCVDVNS